jgi:hypothetical protein
MKGCIALATALAMLVFAQGAFAQAGQVTVCPTYDGKSQNGSWEGSAAPGITILSASDEQVTVRVEEGFTLVRFCFKTGSGGGGETSAQAPITGPATFTITKTNRGGGISHVTFDTEPTSTPADRCPNIEGVQTSVPAGMVKDASGNCVQPPEQPADVCPNIEGVQTQVPSGMVTDASGNCVQPPEQPADVCPNIEGVQTQVPSGMVKDASGNCVQRPQQPADVCPNIEGLQTALPAGFVKDASGNCVCPPVTVTINNAPPASPQAVAQPTAAATPAVQQTTHLVAPATPKAKTAKKAKKAKKKAKRVKKAKQKAKRAKGKVKARPRVLPFTP